MLGASDEMQLANAVTQNRVIVTQDTDFLRIAATVHDSPGIVFFHAQKLSIGAIIRGVLLIWEVLEPGDMTNRIEYL